MVRAVAAGLVFVALLTTCSSTPPDPSLHLFRTASGRSWYLVANDETATPAPLVVLLDGYDGRPQDLIRDSGIEQEAARDGFVVAAPAASGLGWNAGQCCGAVIAGLVDDVGFVESVIAQLAKSRVADPAHVYVAGFSNGGMLAYELGCVDPGLAGIAVVEGAWTDPCDTHPPDDAIVIHQLGDGVVPYAGLPDPPSSLGARSSFPSVLSSVAAWQASEGCPAPPQAVATPDPVTTVEVPCGDVRTEIDVLTGGSHTWPHGLGYPLDATAAIAAFFGLRH